MQPFFKPRKDNKARKLRRRKERQRKRQGKGGNDPTFVLQRDLPLFHYHIKEPTFSCGEPTQEKTKRAVEEVLKNPHVVKIFTLFDASGYEIRIVGGTIRDILLGIPPKDVDFSTTATPQQTIALLKGAGIKVVETGLQHGTVSAMLPLPGQKKNGEPVYEEYEITTLRTDAGHDGRHCETSWVTSWKLDAERRDLTVNSLYMDSRGIIYNYCGGIADLEAGIIRFVGEAEQRIEEDYLRILRYFRFHSRISQTDYHDPKTLEAIQKKKDGLKRISGERIRSELSKIMRTKHAVRTLEKMSELGVLQVCFQGEKSDSPFDKCDFSFEEFERVCGFTKHFVSLLMTFVKTKKELSHLSKRMCLTKKEKTLAEFLYLHRETETSLPDIVFEISQKTAQVQDKFRRLYSELSLYQGKVEISEKVETYEFHEFPITGTDLKSIHVGAKIGPWIGKVRKELLAIWRDSGYEISKPLLLETAKELIKGQFEKEE